MSDVLFREMIFNILCEFKRWLVICVILKYLLNGFYFWNYFVRKL